MNEDQMDDDTILKNLYKDLSELNIKDTSGEDNNSSNETIIHNIKQEEDDPATTVLCPSILGGQVYTANHPSGMVRSTLLGPTKKSMPEPSSTASTTSSSSSTTRQEGYSSNVIHESDCGCPYCFVRKSNKKKLYFSVNAANMIKQSNNTKCSMSRPAAN